MSAKRLKVNPQTLDPHAVWIIKHALKWCQEICGESSDDVERPAGFSLNGGGSVMVGGATGSRHPCQSAPPSWGRETHASYLPPPPSQPTDPRAPFSAASTQVQSKRCHSHRHGSMSEPIPGFMNDGWVFECWTGPCLRWVPYDEPAQVKLRRSYNHNEGLQAVMVNGVEMQVSVAPGNMFQINPCSDRSARKVRLAPKGGWPE